MVEDLQFIKSSDSFEFFLFDNYLDLPIPSVFDRIQFKSLFFNIGFKYKYRYPEDIAKNSQYN